MNRGENLRASDADRELIVARLHKAATEGRIASEELEQRVSRALSALTYAELDETVCDLPAVRGGKPVARRASGGWVVASVRANPLLLIFLIPVVAVTAAMVLAATIVWMVLTVVVVILGGRRLPAPTAIWVHGHRGRGRASRRRHEYWA